MNGGSLAPMIGMIVLHALLTLAYAALTNVRDAELRERLAKHSTSRGLYITYGLSILLLRFAIAALAVTAFGQALIDLITIDGPELEQALAYTIVLIPTALVTFVLGDLVPEAIGSSRADSIAPWVMGPMRLLVVLFSPLVSALTAISRWLAGLFGSSDKVNVVTEEELMTLIDASEKEGSIENEEKEMIYSVLEFGDKTAREVMVPRIDIVAIEMATTLDEALSTFIESGHSRLPVYGEDVDNIKGLLYAKDLLAVFRSNSQSSRAIPDLMRKAFFVPESKRADELLSELRVKKVHMAVVVDEYGGTAGIVTFEDLIEEIIGDVQDEYDFNEEAEYVELSNDLFLVDAGMNLDDFNDLLDVELSTEDSDTLGGFVFKQLGRVPEVGETFDYENLHLKIEALDGRRIRKVRVTRLQPAPDKPGNDDERRTTGDSRAVAVTE